MPSSTTSATDLIRTSLSASQLADEPGIQPSILMHKNIDHDNVGEYTDCYVNDSWAGRLKELIDSGWVVFRIQTEFGINGHYTKAYLAKMKMN